MTTLREAAQQALDDLRDLHANHNITYAGTISRLEAALAQQQAEPVARPATLSKPCGSLGEDVLPCRYPDCVGGQAGTVCHIWCPGK